MKYKYMNNYTGELYENLAHAVKAIVCDMMHYPKCRTIKMFSLNRLAE